MEPPENETEPKHLTDKDRKTMEAWLAAHPFGEQDENGIDLALLRRNRKLTPTERLRRLEQAANDMLWLKTHARTPD